MEHLAGLTRP